jgi:hypothetical protein
MRNTNKIFVRNPQGNTPHGRSRHRLEDNIRMDLGEIGREDVDWIHLVLYTEQWRAVVNTIMNLSAQTRGRTS